ncbi:MAG: hypothetical protein ACREOU_11785, partial [Candidatus Eiseniibacteriota bacterium]
MRVVLLTLTLILGFGMRPPCEAGAQSSSPAAGPSVAPAAPADSLDAVPGLLRAGRAADAT